MDFCKKNDNKKKTNVDLDSEDGIVKVPIDVQVFEYKISLKSSYH